MEQAFFSKMIWRQMEALSAPYDNLRVVELPPTQPLSAPVTKILVLRSRVELHWGQTGKAPPAG